MFTNIKNTLVSLLATLLISTAANAQTGVANQFVPFTSMNQTEASYLAWNYGVACADGSTPLHSFFEPGLMTPQQKAFLKSLSCWEHRTTVTNPAAPGGINPGNANTVGDDGDAMGPLQIHKGFVYDATERNAGYNCRINNGPDPEGLGGPKGPVNSTNWWMCASVGLYNAEVTPAEREFCRKVWWSYSCGLAVMYYDRYCGDAWSDLNSDNPAVTAAAINELTRTHNGGPDGPNESATIAYRDGVISKLQHHFPGVISGY